jgi:hypothetical protein
MTQKQKLVELFKERGTLSNFELNEIMFRYSARIWDLEREGYQFKTWHDPNNRQKYYYKLISYPQPDGQMVIACE